MPVAGLVIAVLTASVVGLWPDGAEAAVATPVASVSAPAPEPSRALTPFEQVSSQVDAQKLALLKGDEAGWLAPIDKKLQPRYRTIFKNLRALDLTSADMGIDGELTEKGATLTGKVGLTYCFSGVACPAYRLDPTGGAPKIIHKITWTSRGGSWVITRMADSGVSNYLQPAPWENTALTVAAGERVIVAGPKSQAANVKRVLPLAEKAAAVADRYAAQLNNPRAKYRIYLADNKMWKSWYAGAAPPWSVAYHLQLNNTGSDIVVKASKVMPEGNRYITEVIQHELGHSVTLDGNHNRDAEKDQWLTEGVAEYIGYQPGKPQNGYSGDALRFVRSRGRAVKTIAVPSLTEKSDDLAVTRLYATGHFAVACMAEKYGEPKMLNFVQMVLHSGVERDAASQAVYGKPFAAVDKACVSWIKQKL
ncbi:hypothetical protein GCM10009828_009990 [Actinoplanes couchii]|uniref:Peptidase MA-like domain-containing protein n=1 Tax=Actinoplanes couchii TaxID=403638 RepID=A0ABQ3XJ47_9ACTN|nr:hypothetical protein Aco03nite_068440 [Actinoplanes couchii]